MISIHLVNLASVGVFGIILSAAFCDIYWTRKKYLIMAVSMAMVFMFQGIIYFYINSEIVAYLYPLITHIPLAAVLCVLSSKCLWPVISVLTAYLCCQIRRWLALLITAVFSGGLTMQYSAELALTLPVLLILLRYIAPSVRSMSYFTPLVQCQFGLAPALYYGFDYLTRIYTSLLLEGALVAVEFMPFVCSVAYLAFAVYTAAQGRIRSRLEQTQAILNLQVEQAVREIEALRESQEKTSAYRHDMRHHMQYLSSCIENGRLDQAKGYIQEVASRIEADKVTVFCENEAANLIFSAFARRAGDAGIPFLVSAAIPALIHVAESDLCVLLSNALENALHACQKQREKGLPAVIEVSVYEQNATLFLQIINSCDADVAFSREVPVTDVPGHGIGVRSICAIVEQYEGIHTFAVKDGRFILRASL